MVFSIFLLRRRYSFLQIVSVLVICGGVIVMFVPVLRGAKGFGPPLQDFFFFCSGIPLAFSNVYEELFFEKDQVHLAHILAFSSIYQSISIFFVFPIMFIPGLNWKPQGVHTLIDLWNQQKWALKCYVGQPVPVDVCFGCDCQKAFMHLFLFTICYLLTNLGQLGIIQHGNAVFSFIVSALGVPLTEFAFASRLIMGNNVEKLNSYNYISLAILLFGTAFYRLVDVKKHKDDVYATRQSLSANEVVEEHVVVRPGYNSMVPITITTVVDQSTHAEHQRAASFFYKTM